VIHLPAPLINGTLIRRYKRFLADVAIADGRGGTRVVTAHCADPGRLPDLAVEGAAVRLSTSSDPGRKLVHRVELIRQAGVWVGADTANANRLVAHALGRPDPSAPVTAAVRHLHQALPPFIAVRAEVAVETGTRLDFVLDGADGSPVFLEVKNVTWRRRTASTDRGEFPDAPTLRGTRHLRFLTGRAAAGESAVLLFVAQRPDIDTLTVAADIDPAYAAAMEEARRAGVRVLAYRCEINHEAIFMAGEIAFV